MDRSTRRRRLGVAAIIVAALASAGTSASPTPTPALSSIQEGTLTVTADAPVAWVDVEANEDPNLVAADGQTAVRIAGNAHDLGVFLIAEELGAPTNGYTGLGSVSRTASCPAGAPCGAKIRLTAILVDPVGHPSVDVGYTATAETRFPANGGPVPNATIDVDVSEITTISADVAGLSTTRPEEIHVGPDAPRAARTVHVSLPAGLPADATLLPNALVLTTDLDGDPGYAPEVSVRSVSRGQTADVPSYAPLLWPFADCQVAVPCETDLELQFDWNGGSAEGTSLEWSLAVWPGAGAEETAGATTIDPSVPADVPWDGPVLAASMSGQTPLSGSGGPYTNLNAALDLTDVPQAVGNVEGLLRLTLRASLASGTNPAAKVRLSFGGTDYEIPGPGETMTVYSRADDISCGGRSVCPLNAAYAFGFNRDSGDLPDAVVDWTADVEFLPLGAGDVPDGAKIDLIVPSPPP